MTTKIKAGVIGDGVVGTTQIAANAVTGAKLAQNSVLTKHIDDNQIGIDQLNVSDGSDGQALTTNGSGTLSFASVGVSGISSSANATAITIDSSERVGIGTGSPSAPLDVVTDTVVYAAEFTQSNTSNGDGVFISVGSTAAADYALTVRSNAGNTSVLAAKADGKVGIGLFSPAKTLDVSGEIRASTGILFGSNTAAANTLDYYEEGTWTPAFVTSGGVTTSSITNHLATYTRIGNIVNIYAKISVTLSSLPGQQVSISGLPFAASNSTHQHAMIGIGTATNTGGNTPKAHFITNGSQLDGLYYNASNNTATWAYAHMDSPTFHISIHGHYTV